MNLFFAYLIKSSVSLTLFYIVFKLTVSRDKMHSVNRFVLLGVLIVSAILPLADIPVFQEIPVISNIDVFREFVVVPVYSVAPIFEKVQSSPVTKSVDVNPYLVFYIFIISLLFIRLLISTIRVMKIIRNSEKRQFRQIILAVVKDLIQPFTFLKHIIISEKDFTENREIIVTHEYAHIKHLHAIDLLICELFTALHWFNPFMWFLRRDLKLIHEFQADQAVLNNGIDAKKYQLLVIEKSIGERRFAMANYFLQKPILKRLEMMKKKTKNHWKGVKLILFIPVLLLLLQAFARPEIIVEKASVLVPVITQQDEAERWLAMWSFRNKEFKLIPKLELNISELNQKPNNVFIILMNSFDNYLIENEKANKADIKKLVKDFLIGNTIKGEAAPDYVEREFPNVGEVRISQGVIRYIFDRGSSLGAINYTMRSIGEAFLEVRQGKAEKLFGEDYFHLTENNRKVINTIVPLNFAISDRAIKPPPPPKNKLIADTLSITIMADDNLETTSKNVQEFIKKYGGEHSIVNIIAKEGVSEEEVDQVKEVLRKAGVTKNNIKIMK